MPRITQRMVLHLNCGKDGHRAAYDIYVDGRKTRMQRMRTVKNGAAESDEIVDGDESFDMIRADFKASKEWIISRAKEEQSHD